MKRYFLLAILFVVPSVILAQKELKSISYKGFDLPVEYIQYPTDPLGKEYKTYQTVVNLPQGINYTNLSGAINDALQIKGFDQVADNGDLQIKFTVSNFEFKQPEIVSTNSQGEDCALHIFYSYAYQLELYDTKTKKTLAQQSKTTMQLGKDQGDMWSQSYRKRSDLDADMKKLDQIKYDILDKVLVGVCKDYGRSWSSKYGTQKTTGNVNLLRIYEKDYYETYFFLAQAYKLQQLFKNKVKLNAPPVKSKEDIDQFVKYNEDLLAKKKNMAPQAENTIAAICYYNIGWIYYLYDDPQKAIEYGEKALATGELKNYANNLVSASKALISIFEKNGVTSRYLAE